MRRGDRLNGHPMRRIFFSTENGHSSPVRAVRQENIRCYSVGIDRGNAFATYQEIVNCKLFSIFAFFFFFLNMTYRCERSREHKRLIITGNAFSVRRSRTSTVSESDATNRYIHQLIVKLN